MALDEARSHYCVVKSAWECLFCISQAIRNMPSPVRFSVVRDLLEGAGADQTVRITFFTREGSDPVSIPVHKNLVKYGYVRRIKKIIAAEDASEEQGEGQTDGETGSIQPGDLENGSKDGELVSDHS